MNGWIKLHRSILDWEWYSDHAATSVFIHLLLTANYEDSRFLGHLIPRGSCVVGRNALAETLGITPSRVRTALDHLKSTNEIAIKTTNKFSIISVINWELYQGDDQQIANKSPTNRQQIATSKEEKKKRKVSTPEISLGEWEEVNGVISPSHVPKFLETYGEALTKQYLAQFRNSCGAKDRKYVNFAKAFQAWNWPAPPKKEAKSWVAVQG